MERFGAKTRAALFFGTIGVGVILFFLATRPASAPAVEPLVNTFDRSPSGFSFNYPADWEYQTPFQGVLLAGLPESLNNIVPGPIFTVQRALTMSIVGDLSGAIATYLESGPLFEQLDAWQVTVPEADTTIDGRPARVIELEGTDPAGLSLHTRIVATAADNSLIYLFITTAPLAQAARFRPTFDAMLASVEIFE